MSLRRKLERLKGAASIGSSAAPVENRPSPVRAVSYPADEILLDGGVRFVRQRFDAGHRHGHVPVHELFGAGARGVGALFKNPALDGIDVASALFVDTETTGLAGGAGTVPFLVGMAWRDSETEVLEVEQGLLCRFGCEAPVLARLAERLRRASCIVTYNGKSFDWPLLRTRFILNRIAVPELPPHLDVLHLARRVLKARLGGMRLVRVEAEVLGFERIDDIDGELIPARYFTFLRDGDPELLEPVLRHNVHDLLALVATLGRLTSAYRGEVHLGPEATLALAAMATEIDPGRALALIEATLAAARAPGHLAAAFAQRAELVHAEDAEAARRDLHTALELAPEAADAPRWHLRLAKLYEHRFDQPEAAHRHAECAAAAEKPEAHQRRLERLRRAGTTPA